MSLIKYLTRDNGLKLKTINLTNGFNDNSYIVKSGVTITIPNEKYWIVSDCLVMEDETSIVEVELGGKLEVT